MLFPNVALNFGWFLKHFGHLRYFCVFLVIFETLLVILETLLVILETVLVISDNIFGYFLKHLWSFLKHSWSFLGRCWSHCLPNLGSCKFCFGKRLVDALHDKSLRIKVDRKWFWSLNLFLAAACEPWLFFPFGFFSAEKTEN
jgi:hypothetical protein